MRRFLLALSLLCLLTLPLAAHATDIYDFRVFGNYLDGTPFPTFSFSGYATGLAFYDRHISYYEDISGLFNFYGGPPPGFHGETDYLSTFDNNGFGTDYAYFGDPDFYSFDPAWLSFTGDFTNATYTFHPGTYAATLDLYGDAPNVTGLTLTVTPEASPTPIPEPTPILLVATGLLSTATLARQKRLSS